LEKSGSVILPYILGVALVSASILLVVMVVMPRVRKFESITMEEVEQKLIGATCPYCGDLIKGNQIKNVKVCPICETPHHEECWNENGGCTTFGCEMAPTRRKEVIDLSRMVGSTCPFCGDLIKGNQIPRIKICPSCQTPHHQECWEENRGCTTFGCEMGPKEKE
jgi:uncharacterized CHY-type Zn-finger protein